MRKFIFFLIFILTVQIQSFSQTVNTPSATSYSQNTSNQSASGFSLSNFNTSATLLVTIGLVNPPSGTTLTLSSYSGLTRSTGYNSWSNFTRISFTGTQSNINTALSNLKVNTGSIPGNVYIAVTATENPSGYYYLPSNGHFYRPMSWPSSGYSGTSPTIYTNLLSLATTQTFKGQTGYLVTITSQDEQNFVQSNVPGSNILIALSDRNQEGVWKWDAGPESGTTIKTSNSGGNVSGQYNNWCGGEPNNWGSGENYAVTKWSGGNCWNDFGPPASSFPGSISGYVVEFGTWSDPANQTFTDFYTGFVTHQISCTAAQTPSSPTAVNGSRVGTGTVSISATVPSGVTVDWYTSSSGGNPIVTGSTSYTTPSISITTKYYTQARNSTTGCLSSTRTEVIASVSINETISGVVSIPNGLTLRPTLKLYLVENSNETLLQTVMVNTDGSYTLNPTTHNKTYKIVPSFTPILTMVDFDSVFYEAMNENTPDSQPVGVYLKTGQKLKAGDVDGNGKITIADAYLIAADISGLRELNGSYWYDNSSYSNLSKSNFQNNGSTSFTVNLGTTSQTLNIKYIGKGDANLSESSE
jgi:hypothetical protein